MNRSGFSKAYMPLAMVCTAVMIVMLQFGFIFLLVAMLPSFVAYFIDRDKRHSAFKVVCACNVAATLPSLIPVIKSGLSFQHYDISSMLQNPGTWLFVYSGAAAGWCLVFLCRYIARFVVILMYEYNISTLQNMQKRLVEEWGQRIKQPPGLSSR